MKVSARVRYHPGIILVKLRGNPGKPQSGWSALRFEPTYLPTVVLVLKFSF